VIMLKRLGSGYDSAKLISFIMINLLYSPKNYSGPFSEGVMRSSEPIGPCFHINVLTFNTL